jgi:hypothetical protein
MHKRVVAADFRLAICAPPPNASGVWLAPGSKVKILFEEAGPGARRPWWAGGRIVEVDPRLELPYRVKYWSSSKYPNADQFGWHDFANADAEVAESESDSEEEESNEVMSESE